MQFSYSSALSAVGLLHFCCLQLASVALGQTGTSPDVGIRFQPPSAVVLKDARVVVNPTRILETASVLIEDGKISAVSTGLEAPAGAEVIDCSGKTLYPAFVDAMVEFSAESGKSTTAYWNGNVTPELRMETDMQMDASKVKELRQAGVGVILAVPSTGIIKGQSCVITTAEQSLEHTLLRPSLFQHMRLYPARNSRESYPNSPMGATALVRQTLIDADWYQRAQQAVTADPALPQPEQNAGLKALEAVIRARQTVVMDGTNELYALRVDRVAREFSLKLVVRGSGREYRRLDAIAGMNRTLIVPVDFPDAPKLASQANVEDTTLQSLMHWRLAPENPGRLERAGVEFVLTSDGLSDRKDFLSHVRMAVKRGLSEERALRALTQGPAELLQVEQLAGTLEAGKLANILVASGPLFEEKTEIEETWVQGKRSIWKSRPEVDALGQFELQFEDDQPALVLELSGKASDPQAKLGVVEAFAKQPEEKSPEPGEAEQASDAAEKKQQAEDSEDEGDDTNQPLKPTSIKEFSLKNYRLSGRFDVKGLREDQSGMGWLSAALLEVDGVHSLRGNILWPDGGQSAFYGVRSDADQSKQRDDEGETEKGKRSDGKRSKDDQASSASKLQVEVNFPLGAYGRTAPPDQAEWVLIKNATIWTCSDQGILENADLLVHRGQIHAVGHSLETPAGAVTVDATGMHVSPGIIDCHSHMATDGGVNESAQAVTAEVRIGDFIDPNDITIYRQMAGGVTTSNILHGSANPIGGQNQVIKLRWGALDEDMKMREAPAGIKFALGENVKQSSREDGTRYPRTRMGVEQIIRDRFEAAKLYRSHFDEWSRSADGLPPRRDLELDALAEVLEGKRWVHCHSYRQDEILMILQTLDAYGVTIGSLQHILEGYKVADAMAKYGATGSSFSDWWAYKFEVFDAIPFNGALMHRAGVIVSFNSDDGELARHLNHEAAKAVKYGGVEPSEALKFVTLNPAKQLRIDAWVGSLEPGKHADFVLWSKSPLSTLSVCMETWIDGRKYFDRQQSLQQLKSDTQLHRQLVQLALDQGAASGADDSDDDPSYWWARFDEFCHHGHDEHDLSHQHDDEQH